MTFTPVRGLGSTHTGTQTIDSNLLASDSIDIYALIIPWFQVDPTKTDGTIGHYTWNGASPAGTIASETVATNLTIVNNLKAVGAAGRKWVIMFDAGQKTPKGVIGADVGDSDFPSGLTGLSPGIRMGSSAHSGANQVRYDRAPKPWDSAFLTAFSNMIVAFATMASTTFVSGSSGPVLMDSCVGVRITGINDDTDEIRLPQQWPQFLGTSANGRGTTVATTIAAASNGASLPQATINVASTTGANSSGTVYVTTGAGVQTVTYAGLGGGGTTFTGCSGGTGTMSTGGNAIAWVPGVSICPQLWADNGYKPSLVSGAMDTLRALFLANFPNATLQIACIPTGATSSAFPSVNESSNWPVCSIDVAATLALTGKSNTTATTLCVDTAAFPAGQTIADFLDPAVTGQLETLLVPVTAGSGDQCEVMYYGGIDTVNSRFTAVTHSGTNRTLLAKTAITGSSTSTWGGVVLNCVTTNFFDGGLCTVEGLATGGGTLGADLNGGVYTLRLYSGGVTLTNPDGTPVTSTHSWTSGGFVYPLTAAEIDLYQEKNLVINAAAALGNQLMVMHNSLDGGFDTFLDWAANDPTMTPYNVQLGGQLNEGELGTQFTNSGATTTTATAGVPTSTVTVAGRTPFPQTTRSRSDAVTTTSSATVTSATATFTSADLNTLITGTGIPANTYVGIVNSTTSIGLSSSATANVPVNITGTGGSAKTINLYPFSACVNGVTTTITGGGGTGAGSFSGATPSVVYSTGDRVSWSPSYLLAVQGAVLQNIAYCEGFRYVNLDADTLAAHLLLVDVIYGLDSLKIEIGFGSEPLATSVMWTEVTSDATTVTINRGRSTALDQFQSGNATITLRNITADFDPLNASGPYYGQILPMTPVRISMNDSTFTNQTLFYGYVQPRGGWSYAYQPPAASFVTINCVDFFAVLATIKLPTVDPMLEGTTAETQLLPLVLAHTLPSPEGGWSIDTGRMPLTAYTGGVNALQFVQSLATAELGAFYVLKTGVPQFDNRYAPILTTRMTTVQHAFNDNGSDIPFGADGFAMDYANVIYNNAQYATVGGVSVTYQDDDSVAAYTESDFAVGTVPLQTAADVQANAVFIVEQYKDPTAGPSALTLHPLKSDTVLNAALALELRDRCSVAVTVPGMGSQHSADVFLEHITYNIAADPREFTAAVNFSPARFGFTTGVTFFTADTSSADGTDILGY